MKTFKEITEAKDKGEYDYEGDMAMSQLKTICRHAEHFMEMLKPDTNLPEWVQSKITLATDYIQTAHDYMMSEVDEAVTHPDEKEDKVLIKKIVKKMLKVKEAYSDPYAAKKSAEMKKAHAATMTDAKKEYDAAKKPKFAKNFMKMKKEEVAQVDEVITKKTPTGEVISDFVHSKNPKFAGKSTKERIRMALGAKYGMMKKEEVEPATEEFKKGDTVYPKVGPHAGHPHKVIHSLENGTHNIRPIGLSAKRTKYRLGAANAKSHELNAVKPAGTRYQEDVNLQELDADTLRSYISKRAKPDQRGRMLIPTNKKHVKGISNANASLTKKYKSKMTAAYNNAAAASYNKAKPGTYHGD